MFEILDLGKSGTFGAVLGRCTAIGGCALGGGRRCESVAASGSKRPAGCLAEVGFMSLYGDWEQTICDGRLDAGDRAGRCVPKTKTPARGRGGCSWSLQGVVSFRSLELSANRFSILRAVDTDVNPLYTGPWPVGSRACLTPYSTDPI